MEDIELNEKKSPYLIITSPTFIKETIGKYVSYKITGRDDSGDIETQRRYNEFKILRSNLSQIWGGIYIPPLPKPQFIVFVTQGNFKPDFVEDRRKILEKFIQQCSGIKYIYNSKDFQTFIKSDSPFAAVKYSLLEVCQIVQSEFPRHNDFEIKEEYSQKLELAVKNFNAGLDSLGAFKKIVSKTCAAMDSFQEGFIGLVVGTKQVAEVYKCKNFEVKPRLMFTNPYWCLQDWAASEVLDTEAMLEAINRLENYNTIFANLQRKLDEETKELNALKEGKKKLITIFKIKNHEEVLKEKEAELEAIEKDISAVTSIRKIFNNVMLEDDIYKFVSNKNHLYEKILKNFAFNTIDEYQEAINVMKSIENELGQY